jgi:hypothetical protein
MCHALRAALCACARRLSVTHMLLVRRPYPVLQAFRAAAKELEPPGAQTGPALAYTRLWELLDTMMEVSRTVWSGCMYMQ